MLHAYMLICHGTLHSLLQDPGPFSIARVAQRLEFLFQRLVGDKFSWQWIQQSWTLFAQTLKDAWVLDKVTSAFCSIGELASVTFRKSWSKAVRYGTQLHCCCHLRCSDTINVTLQVHQAKAQLLATGLPPSCHGMLKVTQQLII